MNITISPTKLRKTLIYLILGLLVLNFSFIFMKFVHKGEAALRYLKYFDFNHERSLPTLFSGMQLFLSSILLYVISRKGYDKKTKRLLWLGLALLFIFLTIDELISLHESLTPLTHELIEVSSEFLTFAWVIPYTMGCILFVLLYLDFLRVLPPQTRSLFIISGFIFCSGALGMELIGGQIYSRVGSDNLIFYLITTLEETLEMLGICLFIYALASYISKDLGPLKVTFKNKTNV